MTRYLFSSQVFIFSFDKREIGGREHDRSNVNRNGEV